MELLQDGYLTADAAAAGCTMAKPNPDDGIDWILGYVSPLGVKRSGGVGTQAAVLDDIDEAQLDDEQDAADVDDAGLFQS